MPWKEADKMSLRAEFVALARRPGVSVAEAARRYSISRRCAYKWLERDASGEGLADRSRRPRRRPGQTDRLVERAVVEARLEFPVWGGRKLRRVLLNRGVEGVPAASTITEILRRHGLLDESRSAAHRPMTRFEHERPNDLWQMDFKGHFALDAGGRCHPLTVIDDHSRFSLGVRACGNERGSTVRAELTRIFGTYGLPRRILADNGSPWGGGSGERYTPLTVWLLCLGVEVGHGRPYHPQTQGKDERFHRTLKEELLAFCRMRDLADAQHRFDAWRGVYNHERPHEALGLGVPAERYGLSPRAMPGRIEEFEYGPDDQTRKVDEGGRLSFRGLRLRVPKAFRGHTVGLRPTSRDGVLELRFRHHQIGEVDLRAEEPCVRLCGRDAPSEADAWV